MAETPIEEYAFIGDQHTGALVSREGSIDWLCLPRFDSPAVLAALLGDQDNGHWQVSVRDGAVTGRQYEGDSFILRTTWAGPRGTAVVTDFMPTSGDGSDLVRMVECTEGEVDVDQTLVMRFSYGKVRPWVRRMEQDGEPVLVAVAGPASLTLHGPLPEGRPQGGRVGRVRLAAGEQVCWVLTAQESWRSLPPPLKVPEALELTRAYWREFSSQLQVEGPWAGPVRRSLLLLKALTHIGTGGIVAAATTSLPEDFGGERNWDYRFCWLRDAALTLEAMLAHGLTYGARHWRDWLLRAVAGDPRDLQIMYGLGGERELPERELEHLPGYAGSRPVRVGNGAVGQYQADVVGEVMIALAGLRDTGVAEDGFSWSLQCAMLAYLEEHLDRPDNGIWEMRGQPRFFTHGRVMMWAAFDQAIRAVHERGLDGPVERWQQLRDRLHEEIWQRGFDRASGSFLQAYGLDEVDAALLQLPHTGFLAHDDPAMLGTVARIEAELVDEHGMVTRYRTAAGLDGLAGHEAPFLICTFWLVEQYALSGRVADAELLMGRLVDAASELGLYAEEYDPVHRRHVGNFPQAFSHLGLVRAADALARAHHG